MLEVFIVRGQRSPFAVKAAARWNRALLFDLYAERTLWRASICRSIGALSRHINPGETVRPTAPSLCSPDSELGYWIPQEPHTTAWCVFAKMRSLV